MSIMSRDICCCQDTRRLHVDRVKPLRGPLARALSPGVHLIRRRCAARYFQGAWSSQTGLFSDANLSFVLFALSRSFLQVTRMWGWIFYLQECVHVCALTRIIVCAFVGFFNYFIFIIFIFFVLPVRLSSVTSACANKREPVNWENWCIPYLCRVELSARNHSKQWQQIINTFTWKGQLSPAISSGQVVLCFLLFFYPASPSIPQPSMDWGGGKPRRWHGSFRAVLQQKVWRTHLFSLMRTEKPQWFSHPYRQTSTRLLIHLLIDDVPGHPSSHQREAERRLSMAAQRKTEKGRN